MKKKYPKRKNREDRLKDMRKAMKHLINTIEHEFVPYAEACKYREFVDYGWIFCKNKKHRRYNTRYSNLNAKCDVSDCPKIRSQQ